MSRATFILRNNDDRQRAATLIAHAPVGTRVDVKAARRSVPQNDKLWASLTDLSNQLTWHGQRLSPPDWKLVMLDGLKRELRLVPNINHNGFVNLGTSSRDLSKDEMSQLIELTLAFGAEHGVQFGRDRQEAA